MSDPEFSGQEARSASEEDLSSALFAQLVVQQANMAMMLLGQAPDAQTGETTRDLQGAKMFIDQLAMLEAKTKGNLSKEEERLLKQSLMTLRMAFVEAVESPAQSGPPPKSPGETPSAGHEGQPSGEPSAPEAESRKKFSKKY